MTDFTTLRGGLIVREDAVRLYLALEERGHVLTAKDGTLLVTNGASLTADERQQITTLKSQLIACVLYQAPEAP